MALQALVSSSKSSYPGWISCSDTQLEEGYHPPMIQGNCNLFLPLACITGWSSEREGKPPLPQWAIMI